MGKRSVDIKSLTGDLVLLLGAHGAEGAHIVQPVCHFYQHYPDVGRHRQQKFTEVLRLKRSLVSEYTAGNLC